VCWCGLACASLPRDSLARLDYTGLINFWGHTLDGYGYTHDPLGLRTNITRSLGLTNSSVAVGYDSMGQLTSWQAREGLSGPLRLNEQVGWGYDAAGNLRYRTNGGLLQTFTMDPVNQLTNVARSNTMTLSGVTPGPATSVTVNSQPAQTYGDFTFARTNVALNDGKNTFLIAAQSATGTNATNNLTVNLPSSATLLYDSNGNLTNDGTRSFAYDAGNRLVTNWVASAWKTEFVYDGLGRRRIERDYGWQGGAWTKTNELHFIYDGWLVVQERDSNNVGRVTYTRGLDLSGSLQGAGGIGGLLARTDTNSSAFYHADCAGNVTGLMDGSQNMAARYLYGPFGKLAGKWGALADANVMQFSSMPRHANSGLSLFLFRPYDTTLQRWLNHDPIGIRGGANLYRFVGNSPVSRIDPMGLAGGVLDDLSTLSGDMGEYLNDERARVQAEGSMFLEGLARVFPVTSGVIDLYENASGYNFFHPDKIVPVSQLGDPLQDALFTLADLTLALPMKMPAVARCPAKNTESKMTTVIGALEDTAKFKGQPGFNVLDVPDSIYKAMSPAEFDRLNASWLNTALQRGDSIWAVTDPAAHMQFLERIEPGLSLGSRYLNLELPMLQEFGARISMQPSFPPVVPFVIGR